MDAASGQLLVCQGYSPRGKDGQTQWCCQVRAGTRLLLLRPASLPPAPCLCACRALQLLLLFVASSLQLPHPHACAPCLQGKRVWLLTVASCCDCQASLQATWGGTTVYPCLTLLLLLLCM